jgi:hypothetical protein
MSGSGNVGKTRIALEVTRQSVAGNFWRAGSLVVDLVRSTFLMIASTIHARKGQRRAHYSVTPLEVAAHRRHAAAASFYLLNRPEESGRHKAVPYHARATSETLEAIAAPATSDSSLAKVNSTSVGCDAQVAKPQSTPAITRSLPRMRV